RFRALRKSFRAPPTQLLQRIPGASSQAVLLAMCSVLISPDCLYTTHGTSQPSSALRPRQSTVPRHALYRLGDCPLHNPWQESGVYAKSSSGNTLWFPPRTVELGTRSGMPSYRSNLLSSDIRSFACQTQGGASPGRGLCRLLTSHHHRNDRLPRPVR